MIRRVLAVVCLVAVGVLPAAAPALADNTPPDYPAWSPVNDSSHCLTTNWGGWQCLYGGAIQTQFQRQVTNEQVCAQITALAPSGTQLWLNLGTGNLSVSAIGNYCVTYAAPAGTWQTVTVQAVTGANFGINLLFTQLPDDTATPTVAPSSTSTNTPAASPTRTDTPAPGFTPAPTATGTLVPSATPTPGLAEFNCGDVSFPLLNCGFLGAVGRVTPPDHWTFGVPGDVNPVCSGVDNGFNPPIVDAGFSAGYFVCAQTVVANAVGNLNVQWKGSDSFDSSPGVSWYLQGAGMSYNITSLLASCPVSGGTWCYTTIATVASVGSTTFAVTETGGGEHTLQLVLQRVWIGTGLATPTPGPSSTATPAGSATPLLAPPTETPVGAIGGPPSAGGCGFWDPLCNLGGILEGIFIPSCLACETSPMVKAVETEVPVSPAVFAPLGSLATGSSCQAFGGSHIPIMDQVEHPSVVVLSVTFAPCAHPSQFPTGFFADVRSLATVVTFILFFLYVIRFVQRVFGRRHLSPE